MDEYDSPEMNKYQTALQELKEIKQAQDKLAVKRYALVQKLVSETEFPVNVPAAIEKILAKMESFGNRVLFCEKGFTEMGFGCKQQYDIIYITNTGKVACVQLDETCNWTTSDNIDFIREY